MSWNMGFETNNPADNLEAIVEFLIRYQWLYDLQLTKYFVDKPFEKIPSNWKTALTSLTLEELNAFPCGLFKESWPESLKEFLEASQKLSLPRRPRSCHVIRTELDSSMTKGMNPKKIHEVSQMAGIVDKLCKECGVEHIVDIGSGLGYLGQVLSGCYGNKVLSLESVETRTHGAEKLAVKKDLSNTDFHSATFTLHNTDGCFKELQQMLCDELACKECSEMKMHLAGVENHLPADLTHSECTVTNKHHSGRRHCINAASPQTIPVKSEHDKTKPALCMMGLHCCADLTPTMLRLFTWMPEMTCVVCVGCCYHNMTRAGPNEYNCFPMSSKLQSVMKSAQENHPEWRLDTYALRLAAQETRARWQRQTSEDHAYHMKNVAFRGTVELFCQTEHSELKKTRRKVAKRKDYESFDTYLAAVFDRAKLSGSQDMTRVLSRLQELYCAHKPYMDFIESFTALQVTMQPVLESLIVIDRLQFLREHDICATAVPIFNEEISPRNLALIAWKNTRDV